MVKGIVVNGDGVTLTLPTVFTVLGIIIAALVFYFTTQGELSAEVRVHSATLKNIDKQFERIEKWIDGIDVKIDVLNTKTDVLNTKIDTKIEILNNKVDGLGTKVERLLVLLKEK